MTKKLLLLSLCGILLGVIGCGQTGDLYLPKDKQDQSKLEANK